VEATLAPHDLEMSVILRKGVIFVAIIVL